MLRPCSARSSNASPIEPTWALASPSVDDGAEAPPSPRCRSRSATRRSLTADNPRVYAARSDALSWSVE